MDLSIVDIKTLELDKSSSKNRAFPFFYCIHLSHACSESAKNFGNIKINYFLWCCGVLFNCILGCSYAHH